MYKRESEAQEPVCLRQAPVPQTTYWSPIRFPRRTVTKRGPRPHPSRRKSMTQARRGVTPPIKSPPPSSLRFPGIPA
eukprot:scaffold130282_cov54-Phaeocystis_antarctica.AAC.1